MLGVLWSIISRDLQKRHKKEVNYANKNANKIVNYANKNANKFAQKLAGSAIWGAFIFYLRLFK